MGIGCRRDPLEANVWYVKAAEDGDERAKQRLLNIQAAAGGSGYMGEKVTTPTGRLKKGGKDGNGDEKCVVM